MNYKTVKIVRYGAVVWVWMNRPDVHNAFDETLIAELTEAFNALDRDPGVRVIVLAGAGKSFSAGADLNWMKQQGAASPDANLSDARKLASLFRTISTCTKPTIARVHGAALGGGMGLASACDICIASTKSSVRDLRGSTRNHSGSHRAVRRTRDRGTPGLPLLSDGRTDRRGARARARSCT